MDSVFFTLIVKIIPLYMCIVLGFIGGKTLDIHRDTIAKIMFFLINPLIILNGVLSVKLSANVLSLPLLTFCIATSLSLFFYWWGGRIWDDTTRNLVAFSSGTGNTGYFGLPIAILLFSDEGEGDYILAILGITLWENSIGYYLMAKGIHPASDCIAKLFKLPALYAFFSGLLLNFSGVPVPSVFFDFMIHIKGTFTVLGMMIIGLGLAGLNHFTLDKTFIGMTFLAKFIVWPIIILIVIAIDSTFFHIYTPNMRNSLILMSTVPLGVNMAIIASLLKSQPEKAATSILLSTFFALIYIPLMATFFIET